MKKKYSGTPISSNIQLHKKIGNIETNPISISERMFEHANEFFLLLVLFYKANRHTFLLFLPIYLLHVNYSLNL